MLSLLEIPYRLWMYLRNQGYHLGWLHANTLQNSYVVSIGNLSVGGSGKTPLTEFLMQELLEQYKAQHPETCSLESPLPFAVLSRGYRSKDSKKNAPLLFSPVLKKKSPSPLACGDEPYLLAKRLSSIWFGIGPNRFDSGQHLIEKGVRCFLLDDGLQHRKLKRDCDLVLLDAEHPFANGHLLPRGALREDPSALARASAIVLYPVKSKEQFRQSLKQITPYTKAPVIGIACQTTDLLTLNEKKAVLKGNTVAILCGIARPARFLQTVQEQGLRIVTEKIVEDHGLISPEELLKFAEQAATLGASCILCTEKDAVKWSVHPDLPKLPALPIPLLYFRLHLKVVAGKEHWDALVRSIYASIPF